MYLVVLVNVREHSFEIKERDIKDIDIAFAFAKHWTRKPDDSSCKRHECIAFIARDRDQDNFGDLLSDDDEQYVGMVIGGFAKSLIPRKDN